MNILQAIDDPALFRPWFPKPATWVAWRAFTAALFGLPMSEAEAAVYRRCTAREGLPDAPFNEAWLICGRRAGKSFTLALIATYLAAFNDYRAHLTPGERATVLVIATDRKQARTIFNYARALLQRVPMLRQMVEREAAEEIDLINGVTLEVGTSSYRSIRGRTVAAGLCDELAFWPSDDAADPDFAVLDALRPAMATIPNAVLLCASSPYARRGALYDAHRRHYGKPSPVLVWQAPTRTMNPTVRQSVVDEAMERDPASARAEWLAEWRDDVEGFVSREVVERLVPPGVVERAPVPGTRYRAFVDPSGGAADSFTLAIAHADGGKGVLDAVRERRAPFSPEAAVTEFVEVLRRYDVTVVVGDRYAGEWPREAFRRHGIEYRPSELPKSALYASLLPRLNSGEVTLLDVPVLVNQLAGLERRTARGGRDSIDHAPNTHDDVANAVAGVLAGKFFAAPIAASAPSRMMGPLLPHEHTRLIGRRAPPDWFKRGDLYPPGDRRWKLPDGQKWLAERGSGGENQ